MCGISGIINQHQKAVDNSEIKKINRLIAHRGPDDEGFYLEDNFAFGHRRLSILDLSLDGHQPMHYLDRYTITYNGEVYNYLEIREELLSFGYKFHSQTDTEVILASYDKWGEDCVNRFNGMWAFAIYDKEKKIIFCSRDRFGIKPFYYTKVDNKFIFGSEIKQLLEFYPKRYVNQKILMDYIVTSYEEHTDETFFEGIVKLPQSHNLIYNLNSNNFEIKKYYDIKKHKTILNENESIEIYKKSLYHSISLRLRSDVKVGTCLSGGLDSSSISAIASKKYSLESKKRFIAIHAKSTQKSNDESNFAKEVATHCNLNLKIVEPTSSDFINHIDEVIYTQEEPFGGASIFMQYFVMKKAKEEGCKVMLDGQGGDETLLGYEKYYPAYLLNLNFYKMIKEFINSSKNSKLNLKQLLSYFIYFTNSKIRISRLRKKHSYLKDEYLNKIGVETIKENSKNYLNIFKLQRQEIYATKMPHLLKYEDKNSMRNSIETRLPFIDYNVLERALSLNSNMKIKEGWTKYILRKVVNNILPKSIVWRKNKFGFEAPTKSWIDSIEDDMKKSILDSEIIKKITTTIDINKIDNTTKWKLFNIAKWEQVYNVKIN
jgi:asparagine synthase (glutamine-hydrolysing)